MDPHMDWSSEAGHFTAWLAREDNLRFLDDTIGLEHELEAQEQNVGPFRADLLSRFNFFGLEIELWRIGESPIAPKFNLVSKPNDWSKTVIERTARVELTEAKELQLSFWTAFQDFVARQHTPIQATKPLPQHWMKLAISRANGGLVVGLRGRDLGDPRGPGRIHPHRRAGQGTEADKAAIKAEVGQPLIWHNPPDTHSARLYVRRAADLRDRGSWPELHEWLLRRLEALTRV